MVRRRARTYLTAVTAHSTPLFSLSLSSSLAAETSLYRPHASPTPTADLAYSLNATLTPTGSASISGICGYEGLGPERRVKSQRRIVEPRTVGERRRGLRSRVHWAVMSWRMDVGRAERSDEGVGGGVCLEEGKGRHIAVMAEMRRRETYSVKRLVSGWREGRDRRTSQPGWVVGRGTDVNRMCS